MYKLGSVLRVLDSKSQMTTFFCVKLKRVRTLRGLTKIFSSSVTVCFSDHTPTGKHPGDGNTERARNHSPPNQRGTT